MSTPLIKAIELRIVLHPEGRIEVRGPLQDKILCYGLLALATDELRRHWATQEQPSIVIPETVPPALLRPS